MPQVEQKLGSPINFKSTKKQTLIFFEIATAWCFLIAAPEDFVICEIDWLK